MFLRSCAKHCHAKLVPNASVQGGRRVYSGSICGMLAKPGNLAGQRRMHKKINRIDSRGPKLDPKMGPKTGPKIEHKTGPKSPLM